MRVNKSELAHILGVSMPTLSAYLARFGDAFPVIERGGRGRDWWFDHETVAAFLDARRAETMQADGERQAAIRQLGLFGSNGGPPLEDAAPLKPSELLALAKVRKLQREEEYAAGRLVKTADVIEAMQTMLRTMGQAQRSLIRRFADEAGLPTDLRRRLAADLEATQREWCAEMLRLASSPGGMSTQRSLFDDPAADERPGRTTDPVSAEPRAGS